MVTVVYLDLHLEKGLLKFCNSTVFLDKSLQIRPVFSSPHFPTLSAVICVLRIRVKNMPFHIHIQVYLVVFSLDVLNWTTLFLKMTNLKSWEVWLYTIIILLHCSKLLYFQISFFSHILHCCYLVFSFVRNLWYLVKLVSFFKPVLVSKLFNFDRKCFVMHKFVNHDLESTEADKMIVACTLHVHGSGEEGWRRKILQLQLQPLAVTKGSRMVVKNFEQFWQLGFFFYHVRVHVPLLCWPLHSYSFYRNGSHKFCLNFTPQRGCSNLSEHFIWMKF